VITEPVTIAKSNIILDVKPWDDETDMATLEECVRSIEMDGLLWGACKWWISWQLDVFVFVNLTYLWQPLVWKTWKCQG